MSLFTVLMIHCLFQPVGLSEVRNQLEELVQSLKKLKSEVQGKIEEGRNTASSSYAEGTHEEIEDIVKAMRGLASCLS